MNRGTLDGEKGKVVISLFTVTLFLASVLFVVTLSNKASAYTPHAPILINGNADFTAANGVTSGSGTPSDPYIIEGWEIIAATVHGIQVWNTDAHFVIRDVYVHSGGNIYDGINFSFVNNGTVKNTNISQNLRGLVVDRSTEITISVNDLYSNIAESIYFTFSTNITINANIISLSNWGISVESSTNITITNNNLLSNDCGIYVRSTNITIKSNNILNSTDGINIHSTNVTVTSNNISLSRSYGVYIIYSTNVTFTANNIFSNDGNGIELHRSSNITFKANTIVSNSKSGFWLFPYNNITIIANNISDNKDGISIWNANNIIITANNITENYNLGIFISSSMNITVYHNNLINNTIQAFDDRGSENLWDDGYPSGGNYWSDYSGPDLYSGPNQDIPGNDWMGDIPYMIDADSSDRYPLMRPMFPIFSLQLIPGHYFMSFPVTVTNNSIESVLSSISSCYDYVRWYDPLDAGNNWKSYSPYRTYNSLLTLDNTKGFWINITSTCSFTPIGMRPSSTTVSLYQGWNMVGFPSFNTSYTVANLKADLGLSGIIIEAFDSNSPSYNLQRLNDSHVMKTGKGYWIFVPSDATWTMSS